ncbi:hypothetical protein NOS3756_60360 (plasmid) [Nostoc sp. NIES-3756]|uniref:hypothetical protein n=1 Tax=Nostoc sp. NIES-3756 TaxID=1751286 RepID=UPI00072147B2|nr:hypothetical protein [Nostoc sp. NIES-3756]BAT57024.1 hypothetical protein NOS3756_60360 [Nostoc sp. NIES-3756]
MSKGKEVGTAATLLAAAGGAASQTTSVTMPAWVGTASAFLATPGGVVVIAGVSVIAVGVLVWKLSSTSSSTTSINPHQSSSDSLKTTNLQPITPIPQNNSGGLNLQVVMNNNINFLFDGKAFSLVTLGICFAIICASIIIYLWKIQPHAPIS